ncbi:MAG: sulfotransferase family protein [Candidatus Limnocylindria bacterium]
MPTGRLPDFFIVGAPKCGTTAMYAYLRQHPQVFMPFHKEPLFFGSDLTHRYGRLTPDDYVALFAEARPGQRVGEASAWYLYSECAAREIHDAAPEAAIVVMLRNPVDVMYAQHSQLLFTRQEEIDDFGAALAAEDDRLAGRRIPAGPLRRENLYYRRMVAFADQLQRYLNIFGRDRVHVIIHEDLAADTPGEYRRLLQFLGVDPSFRTDFTRANENKRVRSRLLQRLIWDPPLLRRAIPLVRRHPWSHALRARVLELNSRKGPRAALDPALRAKLTAELAPQVERLERLIDRDLNRWTASPA